MIFQQYFDSVSCSYTYLIASGKGREAIIIDPVYEKIDNYIQILEHLNLNLVFTLDTHTHADHVTASGALRNQTACQIVMGEHAKQECIDLRLSDNKLFSLDGIDFRVIHTPGHTQDSYCFLMDDRVITGDTLLIGCTGRTDLLEGDAVRQYDSLFKKLLVLPEELLVYPAHDYQGKTHTTIGTEKKSNPRLKVTSVDEYVAIMNELNLPPPKQMDVALPLNMCCGIDTQNT